MLTGSKLNIPVIDLMKDSIRMRPDFIVSEESYAATGHEGLILLHTFSKEAALRGLSSRPINNRAQSRIR